MFHANIKQEVKLNFCIF